MTCRACGNEVSLSTPASHLCPTHWDMLPTVLKNQINAAYWLALATVADRENRQEDYELFNRLSSAYMR